MYLLTLPWCVVSSQLTVPVGCFPTLASLVTPVFLLSLVCWFLLCDRVAVRTALRRDAEAWLVVDGASRVLQVAFRGDAVRLLLLDHVTSAAECALHSRRDFAGPRGRLVKSFEHTRPASCDLEDDVHVATFRHVATGCYRLFHRADGRFSPEGCWVETDAAPARPRPSVALLGSSGSHFRVVHDFAAAFRGSTVAFYARRTLCEFAHNRGDLSWFVDLTVSGKELTGRLPRR